MPLVYLLLILSIGPLVNKDLIFSGSLIVLALISWTTLRQVRSKVQMKNAHNLPILKREREISNLKFDLEKLEAQKIRLPTDLSEFVAANPIRVDERGFESAAQINDRGKF